MNLSLSVGINIKREVLYGQRKCVKPQCEEILMESVEGEMNSVDFVYRNLL